MKKNPPSSATPVLPPAATVPPVRPDLDLAGRPAASTTSPVTPSGGENTEETASSVLQSPGIKDQIYSVMHQLIPISLIGFALASAATAKEPAREKGAGKQVTPQQLITERDTDNDGKLSKEEYLAPYKREAKKAASAERFTSMDTDNDGFLTLGELTAAARPAGGGNRKDN